MAADFSFGIDLAVGDAQGVAGASCASWLRGCLGGFPPFLLASLDIALTMRR